MLMVYNTYQYSRNKGRSSGKKWNQAIQTADFWKLSYKDEFNGGLLKEKTEQGELTNWGYLAKEAKCERNGED